MSRAAVGEGEAHHDLHRADIETSGEDYARRFSGGVGEWFLDTQARCVSELIAEVSSDPLTVLDVGGGHAQLTACLLEAGHRVAVHGSTPCCHKRLTPYRPQVRCVSSDLWRLPFADDSFELVTGVRLLAHVERWRELVAEMARVSRRFVLIDAPLTTPVHRLAPALFGKKRQIEGNTRPYFDYSPEEIGAALRGCGMQLVGERRQFTLPMVLHRALGSAAFSRGAEWSMKALGVTRRFGSPGLFMAAHLREPSRDDPSGSRNSETST